MSLHAHMPDMLECKEASATLVMNTCWLVQQIVWLVLIELFIDRRGVSM